MSESSPREVLAVVGGGSFGCALASMLAARGAEVRLWARTPEVAREINAHHTNRAYLGDVVLDHRVVATTSLKDALADARCVIMATPSHVVRETAHAMAAHLADSAIVVCAAKGIALDTLELMPDVLRQAFAERRDLKLAYLSGPSFAKEVALGFPTSVVIAAASEALAVTAQQFISTPSFRCYTSTDVTGVEVAGALKNVFAIAAGAIDGLGLGANARAAMMTRGLNEMARLGHALGASPLTFAGLAGIGDLLLTCTGDLSRNRRVGQALAQGHSLDEMTRDTRTVAEGIRTAKAAHLLAQRLAVEMPITEQVYCVLHENKSVADALAHLMRREPKPEWPAEFHAVARKLNSPLS